MKKLSTLIITLILAFSMFSNSITQASATTLPTSQTISSIFPDLNLANVVAQKLGKNLSAIISQAELDSIIDLDAGGNSITNLEGLQYLNNIIGLNLNNNQVSDITPLSGLNKITSLNLSNNKISDITPITNMTKMYYLHLTNNKISDITPLKNLIKIDSLGIAYNQINDLSPLSQMTEIAGIDFTSNQVSDISIFVNFKKLTVITAAGNNISDLTPLTGLPVLDQIQLGDNKISDLSVLKTLPSFTRGYFYGQNITLPSREIMTPLIVDNPIIFSDGNFVVINSSNVNNDGTYDSSTNAITWANLTTQNEVKYDFSKLTPAPSGPSLNVNGVAFSGIVTIPLTPAAPKYNYSIEYYKDDINGTPIAIELGKTAISETASLTNPDLEKDFSADWLNLHKPTDYQDGVLQGNYPIISATVTNNVVKVLYLKTTNPIIPITPTNPIIPTTPKIPDAKVFTKLPSKTNVSEGDLIDYTLAGIENAYAGPAQNYQIIDMPPVGLKFVSGNIPAFTNGNGLLYTITYTTTDGTSGIIEKDVDASKPYKFDAPKTTSHINAIIITFKEVPVGFGNNDKIVYRFIVTKTSKQTLVNKGLIKFEINGKAIQIENKSDSKITLIVETGDNTLTSGLLISCTLSLVIYIGFKYRKETV